MYIFSPKKILVSYLLDYLEFCLFKSNVDTSIYPEIVYQKYYSRVLRLFEDTQNDSKLTENSKAHLPSGTNILLFDFYINKFFNSDAISDTMKNYFYPLLIWWKLSNVIPIRASELCTKIPRDCLIVEDNNYYLIINRAKKSQKKGYLPILRKLKINKEFYDLVNDYINLTDKYGKTNTLFSYNAQLHLREELSKNNKLFYSVNSVANNNRKYNKEFYSYNPLRTLLNNFYIKIIGNYFKDTLITEKITLNDTRHFAFTSLSLQGIPMIEIAILGGHSTTRNIDDYTYDNNIYIDREVFKAINKSLAHYKTDKTSISNIVFDMPKVSPIPLEQCIETPFHNILLGYCTAQNEYACESYYCYNCSKWYCEPTIKNYQLLEKIIQKDLDDRLKEVNSNMDFMIKLFKNATILDTENSDKEVALEHNLSIKLRELSNKIQADTNDIIRLKSKLLQGIVDTELTELDIIERLQCLGSTFKDTTEYLEWEECHMAKQKTQFDIDEVNEILDLYKNKIRKEGNILTEYKCKSVSNFNEYLVEENVKRSNGEPFTLYKYNFWAGRHRSTGEYNYGKKIIMQRNEELQKQLSKEAKDLELQDIISIIDKNINDKNKMTALLCHYIKKQKDQDENCH